MSIPNFGHPWILLLLIIPLALITIGWIRGAHRVALPFDHQLASRNNHSKSWYFLLKLSRIIPKLLLAIAIIILAGPRQFEQPKQERELTNIQFCIDVSGSMTAKFGDSDRYAAAMLAMNDFIDKRTGDAFGLTIFGNEFLHWVPLTSDASAFKCAPPFLHPSRLPREYGGTAIGNALRACQKILINREEGDRMIVLFSDGQSSDLYNGKDTEIAKLLKDSNIRLYAIHIGDGTTPEPVETIAQMTSGASFPAGDTASLDIVFKHIDEMSRSKLKRVTPDPIDYYFPFIIAGLSLLSIRLLCLFGLRYTPW